MFKNLDSSHVQDILVHSETESVSTNGSYDVSLTEEHYKVRMLGYGKGDINRQKPLPELVRRKLEGEKSLDNEIQGNIDSKKGFLDMFKDKIGYGSIDEIQSGETHHQFDEEAAIDSFQVTAIDIDNIKDFKAQDDKFNFILAEYEGSSTNSPASYQKGDKGSLGDFDYNNDQQHMNTSSSSIKDKDIDLKNKPQSNELNTSDRAFFDDDPSIKEDKASPLDSFSSNYPNTNKEKMNRDSGWIKNSTDILDKTLSEEANSEKTANVPPKETDTIGIMAGKKSIRKEEQSLDDIIAKDRQQKEVSTSSSSFRIPIVEEKAFQGKNNDHSIDEDQNFFGYDSLGNINKEEHLTFKKSLKSERGGGRERADQSVKENDEMIQSKKPEPEPEPKNKEFDEKNAKDFMLQSKDEQSIELFSDDFSTNKGRKGKKYIHSSGDGDGSYKDEYEQQSMSFSSLSPSRMSSQLSKNNKADAELSFNDNILERRMYKEEYAEDGNKSRLKTDISGRIPIVFAKNKKSHGRMKQEVKDKIFDSSMSELDRVNLWSSSLDVSPAASSSMDNKDIMDTEILDSDIINLIDTIYPKSNKFKKAKSKLARVLRLYRQHDPDVEPCPSMVFVAGIICLMFDEKHAYGILKGLMFQRDLRRNYIPELEGLQLRLYQFQQILKDSDAVLYNHLQNCKVETKDFATSWFTTIFAYRFPFDFVFMMYDWFAIDGFEAVLKMSLCLVVENKKSLLKLDTKEEVLNFLSQNVLALHGDNLRLWFQIAESKRINEFLLRESQNEFYKMLKLERISRQKTIISATEELENLVLYKFNELYKLIKLLLDEKKKIVKISIEKEERMYIVEQLLSSNDLNIQ